MEVYLDGQSYQTAVAESQSLATLIEEVRGQTASDDRMIIAVQCDGEDITGEGFETRMAQPLTAFARVDLFTALPRDLVDDAMTQASEVLQAASEDCKAVVELLSAGKTSEGVERLGDCMRGWYQVNQGIIHALAILNLDANELTVGDRKLADALQGPRERLNQIKEALESRDFVSLSDTLQYEFDEVVTTWNGVIRAIRERL